MKSTEVILKIGSDFVSKEGMLNPERKSWKPDRSRGQDAEIREGSAKTREKIMRPKREC